MSGYDIFKELSNIDEDLIVAPKRLVPMQINVLLCVIAANVCRIVPHGNLILSIIVFALVFATLYCAAFQIINRKENRKLLNECDKNKK